MNFVKVTWLVLGITIDATFIGKQLRDLELVFATAVDSNEWLLNNYGSFSLNDFASASTWERSRASNKDEICRVS